MELKIGDFGLATRL